MSTLNISAMARLGAVSSWWARVAEAMDALLDSRASFRHELHAMNGVHDPDADTAKS